MNANHTDPPVDTARCPLCGGPNHCAMAADPSATECWCGAEKFPRRLLAQLPEEAVDRACICLKCLTRYRETKGDSSVSP